MPNYKPNKKKITIRYIECDNQIYVNATLNRKTFIVNHTNYCNDSLQSSLICTWIFNDLSSIEREKK